MTIGTEGEAEITAVKGEAVGVNTTRTRPVDPFRPRLETGPLQRPRPHPEMLSTRLLQLLRRLPAFVPPSLPPRA